MVVVIFFRRDLRKLRSDPLVTAKIVTRPVGRSNSLYDDGVIDEHCSIFNKHCAKPKHRASVYICYKVIRRVLTADTSTCNIKLTGWRTVTIDLLKKSGPRCWTHQNDRLCLVNCQHLLLRPIDQKSRAEFRLSRVHAGVVDLYVRDAALYCSCSNRFTSRHECWKLSRNRSTSALLERDSNYIDTSFTNKEDGQTSGRAKVWHRLDEMLATANLRTQVKPLLFVTSDCSYSRPVSMNAAVCYVQGARWPKDVVQSSEFRRSWLRASWTTSISCVSHETDVRIWWWWDGKKIWNHESEMRCLTKITSWFRAHAKKPEWSATTGRSSTWAHTSITAKMFIQRMHAQLGVYRASLLTSTVCNAAYCLSVCFPDILNEWPRAQLEIRIL
jgi:hypothetical protein